MRQNEAAKAVSGMWWALSKIFQGKKEKKKKRKEGQMEEGREKEIGLSLGWPWKQQLPGSPGLSSGIASESLPAEFTGEPETLARKFCFKGLPLQLESTVPFRLPNGPPWPRYLAPGLQGCGQRQNWWGGWCEGKRGAEGKELTPIPHRREETGMGRKTGGRCSA